MVRDPVDRAYSNWMHLWSDGLEPERDFEAAFARQDERVRAGWAPFWRYRELGMYGEQLAHLFEHVDRSRVLVMRYRDIVDDPPAAVDRACRFLGIATGHRGHDPARQRAQLCRARLAPDRARPGRADRRPARRSSRRRTCGAGPASRSWPA